MKTVAVAELKTKLSGYLRRVQKGEEVVITSHRHPVARLVPYERLGRLRFVPPTRPLADWNKVKGVKPSKPVDPVALLLEDRAKR